MNSLMFSLNLRKIALLIVLLPLIILFIFTVNAQQVLYFTDDNVNMTIIGYENANTYQMSENKDNDLEYPWGVWLGWWFGEYYDIFWVANVSKSSMNLNGTWTIELYVISTDLEVVNYYCEDPETGIWYPCFYDYLENESIPTVITVGKIISTADGRYIFKQYKSITQFISVGLNKIQINISNFSLKSGERIAIFIGIVDSLLYEYYIEVEYVDVYLDPTKSKVIISTETEDYSALVDFMSNVSKFYHGYVRYWYNGTWWNSLATSMMENYTDEYINSIIGDVYKKPIDAITDAILNYINIDYVLDIYTISEKTMSVVEGLIIFLYSQQYISLGNSLLGINEGISEQIILDNLKQLEENSEKIKIQALYNNRKELINLLLERKNIIENIYKNLPAYDTDLYFRYVDPYAQFITEVGSGPFSPIFSYTTCYKPYTIFKYLTLSLYLELQADYLVTITWLSKLNSIYQPQKLNIVIDAPMIPYRFDPNAFTSEFLGCLRDTNDKAEFVIKLTSNDLENLDNPRLVISVWFTNNTTGKVYVKFGSRATETNYDYVDSSQVVIPNPSAGEYYVLIKGGPIIYKLDTYLEFDSYILIFKTFKTKSVDISYLLNTIVREEYPKPKILDVKIDKNVITLGECFNLTVEVTNIGGNSTWQSIAISSPNITNVSSVEIIDHDLDYFEKYHIGYEAGALYGKEKVNLQYPLFEGGKRDWKKGETHYVKLRIRPEKLGTLILQIKSVARGLGVYASDPPIMGTNYIDQQKEFVKIWKVSVKALPTPAPKIRVEPTKLDFGSFNIGGTICQTVTIYNDGDETLKIYDIRRISGSSEFAYLPCRVPNTYPPFDIPPHENRTLVFEFSPLSTGLKTAKFIIWSNDPNNGNITLYLSGTGITGVVAPPIMEEPPIILLVIGLLLVLIIVKKIRLKI